MQNLQDVTHIDNVKLSDDLSAVVIIDQSLLPNETVYLSLATPCAMHEAILSLRVRGAPAIGICAAYCLYVLACGIKPTNKNEFMAELRKNADYLNSARPTAVNLSWALKRMVAAADKGDDTAKITEILLNESRKIHAEDIEMCRKISEFGLTVIKNGDGILTHCNAGPLATSRYGTALGPLFLAKEKGWNLHVFADETRPLLQGARLTSYELFNAGIDVTLICDNMASVVMKNGLVNACFVGCDRVAANGDTANKIGTNTVAILAKYYNIPFYVLGPTSTVDLNCKTGADIEIELRDGNEIKEKFYTKPMAPSGVKCFNPAFDVTDHTLISGIITEKGICRPPFNESIQELFR
ncbi:MAG: S-methyl-5-thioribose-1-phosphate isomerase [Oscillospiraceae bacterium]